MPEWSRVARRIRVPLGFAFAVVYLWIAHPTSATIGIGLVIVLPGLLMVAVGAGASVAVSKLVFRIFGNPGESR